MDGFYGHVYGIIMTIVIIIIGDGVHGDATRSACRALSDLNGTVV